MNRVDMIEIWDSVEFKINGVHHRGFIKELRKDGMSVKVIEQDFVNSYHDESFDAFMLDINESEFDSFKLEIWSDGRGGDNSAIGVQGCHEPWKLVWMPAAEFDEWKNRRAA